MQNVVTSTQSGLSLVWEIRRGSFNGFTIEAITFQGEETGAIDHQLFVVISTTDATLCRVAAGLLPAGMTVRYGLQKGTGLPHYTPTDGSSTCAPLPEMTFGQDIIVTVTDDIKTTLTLSDLTYVVRYY